MHEPDLGYMQDKELTLQISQDFWTQDSEASTVSGTQGHWCDLEKIRAISACLPVRPIANTVRRFASVPLPIPEIRHATSLHRS